MKKNADDSDVAYVLEVGTDTRMDRSETNMSVVCDGRLVAYVWWCGDDYCDCTQATLALHRPGCKHVYDGSEAHLVGDWVWRGSLFTASEPGAAEELDAVVALLEGNYSEKKWGWLK